MIGPEIKKSMLATAESVLDLPQAEVYPELPVSIETSTLAVIGFLAALQEASFPSIAKPLYGTGFVISPKGLMLRPVPVPLS